MAPGQARSPREQAADPAPARPAAFDLDTAWDVHPQVAVRPEPFGALLYHFGSRRLSFVKDPAVVAVLRALPLGGSARDACTATGTDPVPGGVLAALAQLERTGMIVRRPA